MGKRSRRRTDGGEPATGPATAPAAARPAARRTYRARRDELPPPPWAPLPLSELLILLGLVLLVAWVIAGLRQAPLLGGLGLLLIVVGSMEVAIREHLGGYRSHTTLLAGIAGIGTLELLALAFSPPRYLLVSVAVCVFAFAWWLLRSTFIRRSGVGFRA